MTRAHVRLLGPCFKTGPESTQSLSIADGHLGRSVGESRRQQPSRTGHGIGSVFRCAQVLATSPTHEMRPYNTPLRVSSDSRSDNRGSASCAEATSRTTLRALDRRRTSRDVLLGEKCTPARAVIARRVRACEPKPTASRLTEKPPGRALNLSVRSFGSRRFTPERFHVLLNSLFKVLFNFPSRYLFAIGLVVIFSLRWSLPPT